MLWPVPFAEVYGIIGSLDAICIPSRVPECFSFVLHEAAAAGVPAIVSDLGAPGQFVSAHGSGFVVAPDDVESWVATLKHVAQNPSVLRNCAERVPLPSRVEEEGFFYESLYRQFHLN
jgi:glycosyltransferase involved in cell wall biosynthesis